MVHRSKVAAGQTLEGRFLLLEEIGRGGMSTVFKAEDLEHGRELVAVKVLLPEYSSGLGSWSMFQREAEIGNSLSHPSILRFIALPPNKHRQYIVTEYLPGQTLAARIGDGRRLSEAEAVEIALRVSEAVRYLHAEQIVHYDLKPGNVVLGEGGALHLIDFGMAHRIVTRRFGFAGSAPPMASSNYVAPEQIGRARGRTSVDIYALGAMLYEMLTGHPPFEGDDPFVVASTRQIGDPRSPRQLNPDISRQAEEIVLRALRRDPNERYASAAELIADLRAPTQVRVSGLSERLVTATAWRKGLRWARFLLLIAFAPLALMAASFRLLWWYLERHP
jgi:serine/threonine protein kinase